MLPFEDFSNILVSGISQAGKSVWLHRLCKFSKQMFSPTPIQKVIWVYSHYQDSFQELLQAVDDIVFLPEIPSEEKLKELVKGSAHTLLVIDDALHALQNNPICQELCV